MQRTLNTTLREYIDYPHYSIHSRAGPPAQLVERLGGVNHPWFYLLDRQRLEQSRPLRTGSAPNVFAFATHPLAMRDCISASTKPACAGGIPLANTSL